MLGHAYTVSAAARVSVHGYKLLRVRNPWGDGREWSGPWCDGSPEWNNVTSQEKQELDLRFHEDGESWMSFRDFCANFDRVEVCLLGSLEPTDGSLGPTTEGKENKWANQIYRG